MRTILIKGLLVFIIIINQMPILAGISVVNGLIHEYKIEEGKSYQGVIEIQNTGESPQAVRISKSDFLCNSEGQVFYEKPVKHERSNANWINLRTTDIILNPKEKYRLVYRVDVPVVLSESGSYWSVLIVEPVEDINLEEKINTLNVLTRIRYAIQIVCTTVKPAKAEVQFKTPEVKKIQGRRYLVIDLEDTGELFHRAQVTAEFYDTSSGSNQGVYKSNLQSLFPNTSRRYLLDITTLNPGEYKGVLLADCEGDNIFGLDMMLNIKND